MAARDCRIRQLYFQPVFLGWVPAHPVQKGLDVEVDIEDEGRHHSEHLKVPNYVTWLVLTAVIFTYINIGAYWTYIELASLGSEASPDWVSRLLVYTSFFSVVDFDAGLPFHVPAPEEIHPCPGGRFVIDSRRPLPKRPARELTAATVIIDRSAR